MHFSTLRRCTALIVLSVLAGCNAKSADQKKSEAAPPTPVTVSVPIEREVQDYEEHTGHVDAQYTVEVRARVTGYLDDIKFEDGKEVDDKALLFVIDKRPFKAANDSATAQIAVKKAGVVFREAEYERHKELFPKNAVSRSDYDKAAAAFEEGKAMVLAAEADAELTKLNLDFTEIRAPIAGRVSDRKVDIGNLVVADQTLLTTIVSVDPMYVNFDVDERRLLRIYQDVREGKIKLAEGAKVPMEMALDNDVGFPHAGLIDFSDNQIDEGTGTIRLRAVVPNPLTPQKRRTLVAGMFARVRVPLTERRKAVLVAEQAIGSDQGQKFVYVVDGNKEVQFRRVKTGRTDQGLRVIEEGLKPGEQIIVAGLQRVRPGVKVDAKSVDMSTFETATPAATVKAETPPAAPAASAAPTATGSSTAPQPEKK